MKFIEDKVWTEILNYFYKKQYGSIKGNIKGVQFEALVAFLLKLLFNQYEIEFHPTKASHDGSKDFWAIDELQELWWAECKNYTQNIALKELAPTLVMAELNDVQHLLFFSYSNLNKNLKRHIGRYAFEHKKEVFIYENETIEELLFTNYKEMLSDFLGQQIKADFHHSVEIDFYNEKNPKLIDKKRFNGYYEIMDLAVGEVYNLNVIAENKHKFNSCTIKITIDESEDNYYFEFLSQDKALRNKIMRTIELKPNQIVLCKFKVRLIKYRERLKLPRLCTEVCLNGVQEAKAKADSVAYPCEWNRNNVLIGKHYEDLINIFTHECINNSPMSGFLVYGGGGTGKTRILQECDAVLTKNDYHILNFIGFDKNSSWKDVVREITYSAFAISEDLAFHLMCETDDIVIPSLDDNIKEEIVAFFKLLNKKEFAFEELHRYLKIIFGKLSQGRYAVIIDNMQSYAVEIIDFFKEMIQYMLQHQQSSHIVLLISINTSLVFDDRYLDFIGEFSRIDFLCRKIDGFQNEKQAIAYLKTILSLDDYPLNLPVLRKILASTSLKPKYIQQLANHLIISDCIEFKNQHGIINKSKELEASLRSIPDDYERLFSSSYHMILDKYVQWKSDIYDFISLLHLFFTMDESLLDILNVDRKIVQALVRHGVIKNEGDHRNKCYAFEHDLIESCLSTDIYPDLLKNAMKYLESYQDLFHTILRDKQVPILLYKLSHRMYAGSELITINKHKVLYTIPNKFIFNFHTYLLDNFINKKDEMELNVFIKEVSECCKYVRDHISELSAEYLFDKAFPHVFDIVSNEKNILREQFSFIIHYCENKNRLAKADLSRKIYTLYYERLEACVLNHRDMEREIEYAKAYLENRIFVCGRLEGASLKYVSNLNNSMMTAIAWQFHDILLEDCFDAANLFFMNNEDLKRGIELLKWGFRSFELLPAHTAAKFKVNYYSKLILYQLITQQFEDAIKTANEALSYIKDNEIINYHIFFKCRYLKYKLIALLLIGDCSDILDSTFEQYETNLSITHTDKSDDWLFLQAKYAFLNNNRDNFESIFQRLYTSMDYASSNVNMLEELALKYKLLFPEKIFSEIDDRAKSLSLVNKLLYMTPNEIKAFNADYISKAVIVSIDKKDGFYM
ncbi:ATP-binding protein [[Clostridium] innocuum]|uniref:ATP-binding protein n=1 Tax=Clostridium innocuum TaxID=1522 RepID=UPI0021496796|nr:ATP-binding protein [[Clostridium] innocuum]